MGVLLIVLLPFQLHAQRQYQLPLSNPEAQGVSSQAIMNFLDAVAASQHEMHSLMIVRHGKVIARGWWNPYKILVPQAMYSVSKSFTATAVGFAVAEKKLTVNDKVISFFPEDLPDTVSPYLAELKIKDLLTMSVGHATDPSFIVVANNDNWVKAFFKVPIVHKPGTKFVYNSVATYMLSAIVQKVTGQTIMDYLTPRLFKPLDIRRIDWETDPRGINVGGWGLRLSTQDMAKFGQLFLQKGQWRGKQILPQSWVEEATTMQIEQSPDAPRSAKETNDWLQGYGYQMWRSRHNSYRADGAYGQYIFVLPDQDAVIAITSETPDMQGVMNLVWQHLLPGFKQGRLPSSHLAADVEHRLKWVALPHTSATYSPLEQKIGGKVYLMQPVNGAPASVEFDFKDSQYGGRFCTMKFSSGHTIYNLPFSRDRWVQATTSRPGPYLAANARNNRQGLPPFQVAGYYHWENEKTLKLTLTYLESPHTETFTVTFDGETITMDAVSIFNRYSTDRPKYKGTYGNLSASNAGFNIGFTILQMNDVYEISPLDHGKIGGMARVATIRKDLAAKNKNVYTVIAGDFLSPSAIGTLYDSAAKAKIAGMQMLETLNSAGLNLAVLGNHEFDIKLSELTAAINRSTFDWVNSNVRHNDSALSKIQKNGSPIPASKVIEFKENGAAVRVGLIGLTIPTTGSNRYEVYGRYLDMAAIALNELEGKCDVVIAVTHLDLAMDKELARRFPQINFIAGGHEHINSYDTIGRTVIAKADANARTVYIHSFQYNTATKSLDKQSRLMVVNNAIPEDSAARAVVDRWNAKAHAILQQQGFEPCELLDSLSTPLDGTEASIRTKQTNLGAAICESMMNALADPVDCAILNSGSIRIDDVLNGYVSQYDVFRVLPFGGRIVVKKFPGYLIDSLLRTNYKRERNGSFLQYAGITQKDTSYYIKGKRLTNDRTLYSVAINDYLGTGLQPGLELLGRSEYPLNNAPVLRIPQNDLRKALVAYFREKARAASRKLPANDLRVPCY